MEAKIIISKCVKSKKSFAVRLEKRNNDWIRTWAFAITEGTAKREGYDSETVRGSMGAIDEFPGCPYCSGAGFVLCSCGKTTCWGADGENNTFKCPWCGNVGELADAESFDVSSSGNY